jgi:uncharacterized protein YkwD
MMDRRWVVLLLGISLVANGVLFGLWLRERSQAASLARIEMAEADSTGAATLVTSIPPTATHKPQPLVVEAAPVSPSPTSIPTGTTTPTSTPTEESLPSPTASPTPAATAEPAASPTLEAVGPDWLQYLNIFRTEADLPHLLENTTWSLESAQHSRYMVFTGNLSHNQDPASPYSSRVGQIAAENGNIAAGYLGSDPFKWAFNYWMSAPFHALPILDPQLQRTGFAEYRDATGVQPVAATLDVRRGLGTLPELVSFPILFPRDGGLTWVLRYSLPEFPEALSTCVGYQQPTGAPIILQIGDGREIPQVTASSLFKDGEYLDHCRFDETNYSHPNEFRQNLARQILDQRDAIVLIPRQPLLPDATYAVRVDVSGVTYTWSFRTAAGPP